MKENLKKLKRKKTPPQKRIPQQKINIHSSHIYKTPRWGIGYVSNLCLEIF